MLTNRPRQAGPLAAICGIAATLVADARRLQPVESAGDPRTELLVRRAGGGPRTRRPSLMLDKGPVAAAT